MANATPALLAAVAATNEIPILGTSVTDYAFALEIEGWTGTVGGNISGTSDLAPLDQQAAMIQELFPDAKNIGLLYCSAEANSQYQVDEMTKYLTELGLTATAFAFTDTNDVASVAQAACDASDVLYIPTDNTAASNTEAIANVVLPAKVPVIAGEAGICEGCGIATLSISYYDLGVATGKMAAKILTGEADISQMPVEYAPQVTKMYNAANCEALGVKDGDRVTISTPRGSVTVNVHPTHTVPEGLVNLYHGYSEADANSLLDENHLDPYSGFPAYRSTRCAVKKEG